MEQVEQVADVLKNWRKYSSPESTFTGVLVAALISLIGAVIVTRIKN